MSKIYSRPRIRIPKIVTHTGKKMQSKKAKKMAKMFLILIIAFSTVKVILDAVLPIFDTLCENKAKSIATIISNEQATNVMKEHSYEELFSIEKDNNGNITITDILNQGPWYAKEVEAPTGYRILESDWMAMTSEVTLQVQNEKYVNLNTMRDDA